MNLRLLILIWLMGAGLLSAQQVADTLFNPPLPDPAYPAGAGPLVLIDEGHHNFHTREGRYASFARLLERDGYQVGSTQGEFADARLRQARILVISNALHERNVSDWYLPTPSAFTPNEIRLLNQWVREGGSLFLIADHMPMAGAASDLAASFGFEFTNGFVLDTVVQGPAFFQLRDETLNPSVLTRGRDDSESVTRIATFTGQAFRIPEGANPVLTFPEGFMNFLPDTAWVFNEHTRRMPARGWHQGAIMQFGKGRLAIFGEAAMFSAQLAGPRQLKMGMNNEAAPENYQLLLNIIHWLDGAMER